MPSFSGIMPFGEFIIAAGERVHLRYNCTVDAFQ